MDTHSKVVKMLQTHFLLNSLAFNSNHAGKNWLKSQHKYHISNSPILIFQVYKNLRTFVPSTQIREQDMTGLIVYGKKTPLYIIFQKSLSTTLLILGNWATLHLFTKTLINVSDQKLTEPPYPFLVQ